MKYYVAQYKKQQNYLPNSFSFFLLVGRDICLHLINSAMKLNFQVLSRKTKFYIKFLIQKNLKKVCDFLSLSHLNHAICIMVFTFFLKTFFTESSDFLQQTRNFKWPPLLKALLGAERMTECTTKEMPSVSSSFATVILFTVTDKAAIFSRDN